ncbi:hypothetical protein BQ8794_90189 [Mesorhizobium prunaredense]|uniref:Lectin-like protein BA14k n=1 Tax=Mesorhizobium prunaredense TaxID=1631249 RepID=A0A1R3VL71_9HYPH|nr:hypothetical protein BQ8794_90189 [Mesorhizobium prunaredense]
MISVAIFSVAIFVVSPVTTISGIIAAIATIVLAIVATATSGSRWLPTGALITGAIVNNQYRRVYRGDAHMEWCYSRYRSYRAYDNTYQPYYGPRRQCFSPY